MLRTLALAAIFTAIACTSAGEDAPGPAPGGAVDLVLPAGEHESQPLVTRVSDGPIKALRSVAVGDTLLYGLTLPSFGPRATSAQITVRAVGSYTTGWTLPTFQPVPSLTSTFRLINRTAWDSASFALWEWGVRNQLISRDSTLIATWKIIRGPGSAPGGTLDSSQVQAVRMTPDSVLLTVGRSRIFCTDLLVQTQWVPAATNHAICALAPGSRVEADRGLRPFAGQLAAIGMRRLEPDRWAAYRGR